MSTSSKSIIKNRLLAALPENEYQRLLPHLEPFEFDHGKILYEIDESIKYCYFPSDAVVSLVTQMEDGKIVEVGLVGNEGVTGMPFLLGQKKSAERAIVQIPNGGVHARGRAARNLVTLSQLLVATGRTDSGLQCLTHD